MKALHNNKGISLIELIIVIAIMGVLVGVLAPNFTRYIYKAKRSKDVQTADAIARAVEVAFIEHPEAYDTFQKWHKLAKDVTATYNGETENYSVYLVAANEAPTYCFKGGESTFGDTEGKTGFYGVINRELGLSTTQSNESICPKVKKNGVSPKNTYKMTDRWRIVKRADNGQMEIWAAQPDPYGGYPAYRVWPNVDDNYK